MASYANFSIKDRQKLKQYIQMKLGGGIINLEITDAQLDFVIDEAVETFSKYIHYDTEYYALNVKDVVTITQETPNGNYDPDKGFKLPDNIVGVHAIHDGDTCRFTNQGTTMDFMLYNSGAYPTTPLSGYGLGMGGAFLDIALVQNFVKQAGQMFGYRYNYNYNERSKFLKLDPDPQVSRQGPSVVILEVYVIRQEDELLGEVLIKRLAVAMAKQMIGQVRAKFGSVSFPGGGSVSGDILSEGNTEYEAVMTELKATQPPIMFFLQA